eukprot:Gb_20135 [translate_table: standard]
MSKKLSAVVSNRTTTIECRCSRRECCCVKVKSFYRRKNPHRICTEGALPFVAEVKGGRRKQERNCCPVENAPSDETQGRRMTPQEFRSLQIASKKTNDDCRGMKATGRRRIAKKFEGELNQVRATA